MRATLAVLAAAHALVPLRRGLVGRTHGWREHPSSLRLTDSRTWSQLDDVDDAPAAPDADFGGAVINAVTAVLGVAVAISTVCNLAGYGFIQTEEGLYFGTIQQTRMRYQLDQEAGRAR